MRVVESVFGCFRFFFIYGVWKAKENFIKFLKIGVERSLKIRILLFLVFLERGGG